MEGGFAAHIRGDCRRRGGSDRHSDGDANIGFGNASVSLRDEVEVGGVRGRDGLGSVEVDIADAVDADGAGVLAAPVEHDGLAEIDRGGIGGDGSGWDSGSGGGWTESVGIDSAGLLVAAGDRAERDEGSGHDQGLADSVLHCTHRLSPAIVSISKKSVACEAVSQGRTAHFQLQFGMSAPGPVSARFCVPSASMVMIFMWPALPSAVLA